MADVLKYEEIKSWDDKTLEMKVQALRQELFRERMEKQMAKLEKPHTLKVMKKNIARLLTAQNAQERNRK